MPPKPATDAPEYQGFLEKKGGWDGNQFQVRYFTLQARHLKWYKDRRDKPRGTVDLAEARVVPQCCTLLLHIQIPDSKGYVLKAPTEQSFYEWLHHFERACEVVDSMAREVCPAPSGRTERTTHLASGYC